MEPNLAEQQEKKVEYIELIYDLIFVYLIGRSNSLLDRIEGGFVSFGTFVNYLLASLIVIQIWYHSSLFINRFGKNSVGDKIMLFINMFLLYFIGTNTINGWDANYPVYCGAWALILLNLILHYRLRLPEETDRRVRNSVRGTMTSLAVQAVLILLSIPLYLWTGVALGPYFVVIGFAAAPFLPKAPVNFAHLSERMMLYVVFTFGEMIIAVAEYFTEGLSAEVLLFGFLSFLIVAGLFFSYGYVYDRLLDREKQDTGTLYALLHVFLILSLSCITTALEFMRDEEIRAVPKTVMLVASILVFNVCLALTEKWSIRKFKNGRMFAFLIALEFAGYVFVVMTHTGDGYTVGTVTVAFVFIQLLTLIASDSHTFARKPKKKPEGTDAE